MLDKMFGKKINSIEDVFKSSTKDRSLAINIIMCLVTFFVFYYFPSIFYIICNAFIGNEMICEIVARSLTILVIFSFYYKDLINEFKELKKETGSKIGNSFKHYGIGIAIMMISNLILLIVFKDISTNETQVREILRANPVAMMFTISVLAPLIEELTFRKSLSPLFKNKWLFALASGVLFGLAHLTVDFTSGSFEVARLLYVIPYGSLGFVFALMNRENKSTFSSIGIHCLHNFLSGILILLQGGL